MQPLLKLVLHPGIPTRSVRLRPEVADRFGAAKVGCNQVVDFELIGTPTVDPVCRENLRLRVSGDIADDDLGLGAPADFAKSYRPGLAGSQARIGARSAGIHPDPDDHGEANTRCRGNQPPPPCPSAALLREPGTQQGSGPSGRRDAVRQISGVRQAGEHVFDFG